MIGFFLLSGNGNQIKTTLVSANSPTHSLRVFPYGVLYGLLIVSSGCLIRVFFLLSLFILYHDYHDYYIYYCFLFFLLGRVFFIYLFFSFTV